MERCDTNFSSHRLDITFERRDQIAFSIAARSQLITEVMVVHCNMVDSGEDDSSLGRGNVIDMVKMSVTVSLAAKR